MTRRAPPAAKSAGKRRVPAKPRVKAGTSKTSAHQRRDAFVESFIANGGNATRAAITAGLSAKTAHAQGCRMLKDVYVQQRLAFRRSELREKLELNTEAVLADLGRALFLNPKDLYDAEGKPKKLSELDDLTARALAGYEHEGKVVRFKLQDKVALRDQAMKHLGLFKADNVQRTALDGLPRELIKAMTAKLKAAHG
jgi:phage terminase small subunit